MLGEWKSVQFLGEYEQSLASERHIRAALRAEREKGYRSASQG